MALATADAPLSATGSLRAASSFQPVSWPFSIWPMMIVSVGLPSAPAPAEEIGHAVEGDHGRVGARRGQAGASVQAEKLPEEVVVVMSTESVAASPTRPPATKSCVPFWNVPAPERPCGSASWLGLGCQGTTAPAGAGHGRPSLSGLQKLIGLITL